MKKTFILLFLILISSILISCADKKSVETSENTKATTKETTETKEVIQGFIKLKKKYDGEEINLLGDTVDGYLKSNDKAAYLFETQDKNSNLPKGVNISFETNLNVSKFELLLSSDESFSSFKTIKISKTAYNIYNLIKGKYYYKITSKSLGYESEVDSFEIVNDLRPIYSSYVTNMRDLGGYLTKDGKRTRYELVYRSAEPSLQDAVLFRDELGIKTEIDLRNLDKIENYNGVYPEINYIRVEDGSQSVWSQYDLIFTGSYKDVISSLYKRAYDALSDETMYPINFHCSAGADRAGTFSCLLLALLGVRYDDLASDYELTTYYRGKRFRSLIIADENGYHFSESGIYEVSGDRYAFNLFIDELLDRYTDSKDVNDLDIASYRFLNEYMGIEKDKLDKVIELLTV